MQSVGPSAEYFVKNDIDVKEKFSVILISVYRDEIFILERIMDVLEPQHSETSQQQYFGGYAD